MGRRLRGAALRAAKRIKLADEEIADTKAEQVETKEITEKKDEELFVLDTEAIFPSKKQLEKKIEKKNDPRRNASLKEKAQIEKFMNNYSADELQNMVTKGKQNSRRAVRKGSVQPNFDLWGEELPKLKDEASSGSRKRKEIDPVIGSGMAGTKPSNHIVIATKPAMKPSDKKKAVNIEVAAAGQSYNPDKTLHKKALQEAFQVEEKRLHAEKESKAPIRTGMSAETRAYLLGSDSEDSDEEEEGEENQEDESDDRTVEKKQKKMTKAERNKQKRLRAEQREIENRKREKKLQKSVGEARSVVKHLSRAEIDQAMRREEMEKLKEANQRTKGVKVYDRLSEENPINAPTFPVALSSELKKTGGSLRSIKPKGSLLIDRMASLADRDMTAKKQVKKRKRVEGKRRKSKVRVRGKGHAESKEGEILG